MTEPKRVSGYNVTIKAFVETDMTNPKSLSVVAQAVFDAQQSGKLDGLTTLDGLTVLDTDIKHVKRDRAPIDAIRQAALPQVGEPAPEEPATEDQQPAGDPPPIDEQALAARQAARRNRSAA